MFGCHTALKKSCHSHMEKGDGIEKKWKKFTQKVENFSLWSSSLCHYIISFSYSCSFLFFSSFSLVYICSVIYIGRIEMNPFIVSFTHTHTLTIFLSCHVFIFPHFILGAFFPILSNEIKLLKCEMFVLKLLLFCIGRWMLLACFYYGFIW